MALPEGWRKAIVEDVAEIIMGQSPKGANTNTAGDGIPLVGGASDLGDEYPEPSKYTTQPTKLSQNDDLILCIRATIGRINRSGGQYCLGRGVAGVRSLGADTDWLKYFWEAHEQPLQKLGTGTTFKQVDKKKLNGFPVNVPPFNEQRRIADKIDALQAKSRRAREALETVGPLLEKFRQSVLAAAFRGDLTAEWRKQHPDVEPAEKLLERIRAERRAKWEEAELTKMRAKGKEPKDDKWKAKYKEPEPVDATGLPELPEGWCWAALEELAIHKSGVAYKSKEFVPKGVQVVKLGNLYRGTFDLSRDQSFLPKGHPQLAAGKIDTLDLLVSQTGTRNKRDYGFFVEVPADAPPLVLNQRVLLVRLADSKLNKWVLHAVLMPWYRDFFFSQETGGVNQGNVGLAGVMRGAIPIGPENEMAAISQQIDALLRKMFVVGDLSKSLIDELDVLDQSILAKAFRGELVPQDPNDEPASVLLERIKAEREASKGKKKTRRKKQ